MKKIILGISGGISFLIFLILLFTINHLSHGQLAQTAAQRWSSEGNVSQVSCFFSVDADITQDRIIEFEHGVDQALVDASVFQESENPGARLWADAYSADGQVDISTERASLKADAIGIGGDFFLFHPVTLLYGSYFSGNDLMQDYCVIDEDAAWQLFGSSDVAGMMVYISGIPHIVTGVVRRPAGRLAETAGLDSTVVYVSYQTLEELGENNGINHYEIVMPDPVTGFAQKYIKDNLGTNEKETEVVENTSRYSLLSRLKLLRSFGVRSMNGKAIIYPYWENIARGYEDILALMTLFEVLFFLYPSSLALIFFCIWWRHKGWTLKDVWMKLKDLAERRVERMREERKKRKNGEYVDPEFEDNPDGQDGKFRNIFKNLRKSKAGKAGKTGRRKKARREGGEETGKERKSRRKRKAGKIIEETGTEYREEAWEESEEPGTEYIEEAWEESEEPGTEYREESGEISEETGTEYREESGEESEETGWEYEEETGMENIEESEFGVEERQEDDYEKEPD